MIVQVQYLDEQLRAYKGRAYTYVTDLDLRVYDQVLCPVNNDGKTSNKRAIVVAIELPAETIAPSWADRVQKISEYDVGE